MRVWRHQSTYRLGWVVLVLLVLAVAIFVMAAGFSRLRVEGVPAGGEAEALGAGAWEMQPGYPSACSAALPELVAQEHTSLPPPAQSLLG